MAYKYSFLNPYQTSGCIMNSAFQELLDAQFSNAPDIYTIGEEQVFGSEDFVDITVRVNRAIDSYTMEKLGDDFKLLLFQDTSHPLWMGKKFYFDNNYWIVYNLDTIKNVATSATVRRCNNVLRWVDVDGNYYSEPCIIDYRINRMVDDIRKIDPVMPEGFINIYSQLNSRSRLIVPGQRFLFGNTDHWTAYKVYGNGLRIFLNNETSDNDSSRVIALNAGASFVNEDTDDLALGIADKYHEIYELSVEPTSITGSIGTSYQIVPNVTVNDIPVAEDITYAISDTSIASVSDIGLVSLITNGSAIITAYMTDNTSVSASALATVSASSVMDYEIRITPSTAYVLQGTSSTYGIYGYLGGVIQGDTFTFTLADYNVPSDHYVLSAIDDNHFAVSNSLMYLEAPLIITATSGSYSKNISINLRGAW